MGSKDTALLIFVILEVMMSLWNSIVTFFLLSSFAHLVLY